MKLYNYKNMPKKDITPKCNYFIVVVVIVVLLFYYYCCFSIIINKKTATTCNLKHTEKMCQKPI